MTEAERAENLKAINQILFDYLAKTYVQRADLRQQEMGLQYTTAETHDLAGKMAIMICDLGFKVATLMLAPLQQENERLAERIGELTRESLL